MRIFAYEYLCGGVVTGADSSLRGEGWAMLSAVVDDLCSCAGVNVLTRLHPALMSARDWPKNLVIQGGPPGVAAEEEDVRRLSRQADFALLIAPEFQDILGTRCRWVEEEGGRLLGPSAEAVRSATDKLLLAEQLRERGLTTPATVPWSPESAGLGFPLVVKPRDGAGSQATFLVKDRQELLTCPDRARAEGWTGELIAQPYLAGFHASVSFVMGPGGKFCLKPSGQLLSPKRFRYRGGWLPLPAAQEKATKAAAAKVLTALPGLRGWFGMDVLLTESCQWIIEINPRLTTSYVGLRRLARFNLMDLLISASSSQALPRVQWHETPIGFAADGEIFDRESDLAAFLQRCGEPE